MKSEKHFIAMPEITLSVGHNHLDNYRLIEIKGCVGNVIIRVDINQFHVNKAFISDDCARNIINILSKTLEERNKIRQLLQANDIPLYKDDND